MRCRTSIFLGVTMVGAALLAFQGCGGDVTIAKDGATPGPAPVDTGTGKCGASVCAAGELCCQTDNCTTAALACTKGTHCSSPGPCASPNDGGTPAACDDSACGPVPPVSPDVCPLDQQVTTACERGSDNTCGWKIHCLAKLAWYDTCGGPVCSSTDAGADAGIDPNCAPAGTTCSQKGATCGDPQKNCGVVRVCDDHDPKALGCPISSAKFKKEIRYLHDAELQRLHEETMAIRLATYQYKSQFADPNPTHLGFIIEDQPQSLSVDRGHDRVDMYGYLSMVVATMQVQEKEIASLRRELESAKAASACGVTRNH